MAKVLRHRSGGSDHDDRDHDGSGGDGQYPPDDPEEERLAHLEIEKRRFHGGLPATPELYARAREQWYRLPGSLVRPSMDPVAGNPSTGQRAAPGDTHRGGKGDGR